MPETCENGIGPDYFMYNFTKSNNATKIMYCLMPVFFMKTHYIDRNLANDTSSISSVCALQQKNVCVSFVFLPKATLTI